MHVQCFSEHGNITGTNFKTQYLVIIWKIFQLKTYHMDNRISESRQESLDSWKSGSSASVYSVNQVYLPTVVPVNFTRLVQI